MIQKTYREFAEKEIKPLAAEIDEQERFPKESIKKMADMGLSLAKESDN
jgi:butyryl-CoA dehydrogenase